MTSFFFSPPPPTPQKSLCTYPGKSRKATLDLRKRMKLLGMRMLLWLVSRASVGQRTVCLFVCFVCFFGFGTWLKRFRAGGEKHGRSGYGNRNLFFLLCLGKFKSICSLCLRPHHIVITFAKGFSSVPFPKWGTSDAEIKVPLL